MKVSAGTIARTIVLALALVNQVLTAFGYNVIDISDETINTLISTGFTIVTALIASFVKLLFFQKAISAVTIVKPVLISVFIVSSDISITL